MAVVLDTNVISELGRKRPHPGVVSFIARQSDPYLAAPTVHEIAFGADSLADPAHRLALKNWLDGVQRDFAHRTIAVDAQIARLFGALRGQRARRGRPLTPIDALIAACALSLGAAVATRNTRDFEGIGVTLVNPWDEE